MGNKSKQIQGSVAILKVYSPNIKGYDYTPHFFNDGEETPKPNVGGSRVIAFKRANAFNYSERIESLCKQATDRKISESQLIKKLDSLFNK